MNGVAVVKQIRDRLTLISLTEQEYISTLDSVASASIVGGALYDAFIAQCALKANADVLLTWNVRDFVRLGSQIHRVVKTPLEI
jgi:predicted nucleic acid-binding protein